jgi:hypothetical protein
MSNREGEIEYTVWPAAFVAVFTVGMATLGCPDIDATFVPPAPALRFMAIDFPGASLVFASRAFWICARSDVAAARPGHAA